MRIPAADGRIFDEVCKYNKLPADEIALYKQAYRDDPEAGRITCQALHDEFNQNWREQMNKGITERIKADIEQKRTKDFQQLKEMLLAQAARDAAAGPGQPDGVRLADTPLRPPPGEQREQPAPVWDDPPKEAA